MPESLKPYVVAGYGRSGTTWVQDVLATANSLRAVFEPLNPWHISGARGHAQRYLSVGDVDEELYQFLHRYMVDDFHSLWADYRIAEDRLYPRLDDLVSWHRFMRVMRYGIAAKRNFLRFRRQRRSSRRIVKFVRANMMLGWIKTNFDARMVFVIRHPAAVVMSQMRSPHAWTPQQNLERYRNNFRLLDVIPQGMGRLLSADLGDVEAHCLSWCIENAVALQQAKDCNIPVFYYESLVRRGLPEWKRISHALSLGAVPDERLISKPSQQTYGQKARDADLVRQYAAWAAYIDKSTTKRIQKILDESEFTVYHTDEALPVAEGHAY